jgi:hypothetical protein
MVSGFVRLGLLSDYTANCRPVLSSERAPNRYICLLQTNIHARKNKINEKKIAQKNKNGNVRDQVIKIGKKKQRSRFLQAYGNKIILHLKMAM